MPMMMMTMMPMMIIIIIIITITMLIAQHHQSETVDVLNRVGILSSETLVISCFVLTKMWVN